MELLGLVPASVVRFLVLGIALGLALELVPMVVVLSLVTLGSLVLLVSAGAGVLLEYVTGLVSVILLVFAEEELAVAEIVVAAVAAATDVVDVDVVVVVAVGVVSAVLLAVVAVVTVASVETLAACYVVVGFLSAVGDVVSPIAVPAVVVVDEDKEE